MKIMNGKQFCNECDELLPLESFSRNRKLKTGYSYKCKSCTKSRGWVKGYDKEYAKAYRKTPRGRYGKYKVSAKKRGYDFELSFEEFSAYWQEPCFYCGVDIESIGLDRIVNDEGYSVDNVVSCCSSCNVAKNDRSMGEFIEMCKRVASLHG